tara:strand:- start:2522 stop:3709 length:1188 start_codon:yes stop_codon:yes gene_type:complete
MSKHYNLTVTDDNGKSVTTSNTSTEHSDEILRMMHLAGMQDASCYDESIEENEYQPTPANDKLDLDDYSKKSGESIPKQKKSLDKAPSRGDNPLEYSLDENEIFESLMNEFEEVEEGKLNPGLQAYLDKKKGKKDDKEDKEDKVEEKKAKPDFADIDKDGDKKETMKKAAKDKKEKANESIEEGFEIDEVKAILAKHGVSNIDDMELDGELYQDLFDYYSDEMPYGTQKARDGDPMEYIMMKLDDLGLAESQKNSEEVEDTGLQSELDRLQKLANIQKTSSDEQVDEVEIDESDVRKKYKGKEQEAVDMMIMRDDIDDVQKMHDKDPEKFDAMVKKMSKGIEEGMSIDEVVQLAIPVAKAVGGALLKKGIKGAAARAGAGAVANKMMSKPSSNVQ